MIENKPQHSENYNRIAAAIAYIRENFKKQPGLDEVAEKIHLSPFHFQRLFTEWAGTSPKKFLQYISINHAKSLLKEKQANLFQTAFHTGLSGTGRLHDLFISIEGMTPAEYKNGGENLSIHYSFSETIFGWILTAATPKGLCHAAFGESEENAIGDLKAMFPNAFFQKETDTIQQHALNIFESSLDEWHKIKLHLRASDFELKVWEALLKIPAGRLSTYGEIATKIGAPQASRAVGSAIGKNPVAYLIPCHRVIQSNGNFGGYMWAVTRKAAIIGWEGAKIESGEK